MALDVTERLLTEAALWGAAWPTPSFGTAKLLFRRRMPRGIFVGRASGGRMSPMKQEL